MNSKEILIAVAVFGALLAVISFINKKNTVIVSRDDSGDSGRTIVQMTGEGKTPASTTSRVVRTATTTKPTSTNSRRPTTSSRMQTA